MTRSLLALIAGAVAIGFAPIFVRMSEVGPTSTAFWRILLALPLMLAWAAVSRRSGSAGQGGGRLLVGMGVFFAGDLALWHGAIGLTLVANATLEANLAAVFVTLLSWWIFRSRPSGRFLAGLVLAISGTLLLIGRNAQISRETLVGDAMGIATAVFYSGYLLTVKVARDRGVGTARIMAASGVITVLVLLPISFALGETLWPSTAHGWLILLALALISHLGGQSLIAYAMAGLPANFAAVALLVQPAVAAVAAWVLLGESLAGAQIVGGFILLAGIWLARTNASRK